jgi:hypothetical protein
MPTSLHDAIGDTVKTIIRQPKALSDQAMNVLKWTFLAERPLRVTELCHALAVKPGDTDLDWDNFASEKSLLSCCLGLIMIEAATFTVRLVHLSLQKYLLTQNDTLFPISHSEIAYTCLTYLNFNALSRNSLDSDDKDSEDDDCASGDSDVQDSDDNYSGTKDSNSDYSDTEESEVQSYDVEEFLAEFAFSSMSLVNGGHLHANKPTNLWKHWQLVYSRVTLIYNAVL